MTDRIPPNPHSPYATADPDLRHLIPSLFGIAPNAGGLTLTACERMAVVPDGTLGDASDALEEGRTTDLPAGLCPICVGAATGESVPGRQGPDTCRECGSGSSQGEWCALCRQELHDEWREEQVRKPVRIQRRRTKGWRMPEGAVYVGRPTKWGNPIRITTEYTQRGSRTYRVHGSPTDVNGGPCYVMIETARSFAVRFFMWDMANDRFGDAYPSAEEIRRELAGKDLVCWCPLTDADGAPVPCHADVLLEIANSEDRP